MYMPERSRRPQLEDVELGASMGAAARAAAANGSTTAARSYRVRAAHGGEGADPSADRHARASRRARRTKHAASRVLQLAGVPPHRRAIGTDAAGLSCGAGAYVERGKERQRRRRRSPKRSSGCWTQAQAGADDPALQGPRRDEPRAALGHHHQSGDAPPDAGAHRGRASPPTRSSRR